MTERRRGRDDNLRHLALDARVLTCPPASIVGQHLCASAGRNCKPHQAQSQAYHLSSTNQLYLHTVPTQQSRGTSPVNALRVQERIPRTASVASPSCSQAPPAIALPYGDT